MKLNIIRGVVAEPQKVVIYGPQGIGKSTLASQFPEPLFLDTERGSRRLSVDRLEIETLADFYEAITAIQKQRDFSHYRTVIVDTVDWLEAKVKEKVVAQHSAKDRAYDREGSFIGDDMMKLLGELSKLTDIGKHVVLLAHSITAKIDLPDQPVAFDRYELDMNKKHVAPLIKHWGDALFFLRWKLKVREVDDGKNKGIGGEERLLCTSQSAAYDAKNRYGIIGEHPCDLQGTSSCANALAIIKAGFLSVGAPWDAPAQQAAHVAEQSKDERPNWMKLQDQQQSSPAPATPSAADQSSQVSATKAQAPESVKASDAPMTDGIPGLAPENGGPSEDQLAVVLKDHMTEALAWLVAHKRIPQGGTLADVKDDTRKRILSKPLDFIKVISAGKGVAA